MIWGLTRILRKLEQLSVQVKRNKDKIKVLEKKEEIDRAQIESLQRQLKKSKELKDFKKRVNR